MISGALAVAVMYSTTGSVLNKGAESYIPVVSRRHFFSVAPDWSHATGTMMVALGDLRGFVGE
jgi:hypothetical protein